MFDVAIVGGGVIGAIVARELAKYKLNIVLLESGANVSGGASKANSGIVHAGYDAAEGTLKARFNLAGNAMMPLLCKELGVKCGSIGSLVVAFEPDQTDTLVSLKLRGEKNGVKNIEILDEPALRKIEPNLSQNACGALLAPSGGIVCPYELTIAAMGNAMDNGVKLYTDFMVSKITRRENSVILSCERGFALNDSRENGENGDNVCDKATILNNDLNAATNLNGVRNVEAQIVINCAGLGAEKVSNLFGDYSYKIGARKGEYLLLDKSERGLVNHTVFACPTKAGKGVLVSPTVDGNIILGPTAEDISGDINTQTSVDGLETVLKKAGAMLNSLPTGSVITSFSGLRAFCDRNDFIVEWSKTDDLLFNVAGIESPGLTAAPAIGVYVADLVAQKLSAEKNLKFKPIRQPDYFFKLLSIKEKNELIKARPQFGKIVCRCEEITLGEILDAIKKNPPAKTLDGIKLRTRSGMGRCQGGFCQPHIMEILMKSLGIPETEVTKNGGKTYIIAQKTK